MLSADELLAGSAITVDVEIPPSVLAPGDGAGARAAPRAVRLRPLTVRDLQLVSRAAQDGDSLLAGLMVQRSLVSPELSVPQVAALHVGLVQFLLHHVNEISGISATGEQLATASEHPLAQAAFVLAREFGWTPQQVGEMTLGQVLLHLQMLREQEAK